MIKQVSQSEAEKIFGKYGITVLMWRDSSIQTDQYDGMICDYSKLPGYKVKYACEIWDMKSQKQVERFNVMR